MDTLGKRLAYARQQRGWSQNRLDREAKLTQGRTSRLERDERGPSAETLKRVSQALGIHADWLLTGAPPMEMDEPSEPTLVPNRTTAAQFARADGVYEGAVLAVLAEHPDAQALSRSVLWWTDRMRLRQVEMLATTRPPSEPPGEVQKK